MLHTLCRELDRSEGVLDFMSQASSHFPPCCSALCLQQVGDVIKDYDATTTRVLGQTRPSQQQYLIAFIDRAFHLTLPLPRPL